MSRKPLVYIASRLENHETVRAVRDGLAAFGIGVSYDWTTHGPVWREGPARIREVSLAETMGVLEADLVLVLLPGGRGTHVELGIALGARKPVLILTPGPTADTMEGAVTCAFYHHPEVTVIGLRDVSPASAIILESVARSVRAHARIAGTWDGAE